MLKVEGAALQDVEVGVAQANALLTGLGLTTADGAAGTATGPFNIELFAGSPDDNNATFFFNGAMDVLQPLIDAGTLVVKSKQTDFNTVATLRFRDGTTRTVAGMGVHAYASNEVDALATPLENAIAVAIGLL